MTSYFKKNTAEQGVEWNQSVAQGISKTCISLIIVRYAVNKKKD